MRWIPVWSGQWYSWSGWGPLPWCTTACWLWLPQSCAMELHTSVLCCCLGVVLGIGKLLLNSKSVVPILVIWETTWSLAINWIAMIQALPIGKQFGIWACQPSACSPPCRSVIEIVTDCDNDLQPRGVKRWWRCWVWSLEDGRKMLKIRACRDWSSDIVWPPLWCFILYCYILLVNHSTIIE